MVRATLEAGEVPTNKFGTFVGAAAWAIEARKHFVTTDIGRFIEHNQMSYWIDVGWNYARTNPHGYTHKISVIRVHLNISEDDFTLLKMKLEDPTKLTVKADARD